jgi:hypothetical protein
LLVAFAARVVPTTSKLAATKSAVTSDFFTVATTPRADYLNSELITDVTPLVSNDSLLSLHNSRFCHTSNS